MVNAIILPNFVLTDLVFEGSNFNLRLYGCVDTPLETNPMDKKRLVSSNYCCNDIDYSISLHLSHEIDLVPSALALNSSSLGLAPM